MDEPDSQPEVFELPPEAAPFRYMVLGPLICWERAPWWWAIIHPLRAWRSRLP